MPFNAFNYFFFLPVVFLLHYFCPARLRWLVLLGASFFFYAALKAPHLIAVLLLVTIMTYFSGIWIDLAQSPRTKRYLLWGGISANILILAILKHLPFLNQTLNAVFSPIAGYSLPFSKTVISIGASYFIFQAISYLIDIYLEIEKPELHFGYFALYLSFFPKLLQGPIERSGDLMPQLKKPYEFNYDNVRSGMLMFTWGLFKKVVIADRLALLVNPVYNDVHSYSGSVFIAVTYIYALQIFFDFSGYTDMALGTARMFNFELTQNFNNPYQATSIPDFWRRWHISFSRWILDYIFKPLQMQWRNWKSWGTASALIVTFLISGIWHGVSWTYVIWGLLHGLYLACSVFYKPIQKNIHEQLGLRKSNILKCWQIFFTFNLVSFAWIFFRANNLKDALYVLTHMIESSNNVDKSIYSIYSINDMALIAISIIILFILFCLRSKVDIYAYIRSSSTSLRWGIYSILLFAIVFAYMLTGPNILINRQSFVYTQF